MRSRLSPYLLILPGGLWLGIFFIVPMAAMLNVSLQTGSLETGFSQTLNVHTYVDMISTYHVQLTRSLLYGLMTTVIAIVLAYPMAYWIAFNGGRHKSTYLFLILLPFFVTFVIRTISWQFLLADDGIVLGNLKDWGMLPGSFHILATPTAVVGGLVYNFLPFMVLPIYVALERIDRVLLEAASDLYATRREVFRRVVLPLSLPGVFAGVILTFVPAAADYVNAPDPGWQRAGDDRQHHRDALHQQLAVPAGLGTQLDPARRAADRHLRLRPGARHPRRPRRERGVIGR